MGIISKIFQKSKSNDHLNLIKDIIGKEIKRGEETIKCSTLSDEILLGLPESSIITIMNSWMDYRSKNPNLSRIETFEKIMKERFYGDAKIKETLSNENIEIIQFLNKILEFEDQSGYLSDAQIKTYVKKYLEMTALFWSEHRK